MIMKNNISKYILTIAAGAAMASCADLEQTSPSAIDSTIFYESENDIETAILGIYNKFSDGDDWFYGMFNNQSVYINDLQSDYVKAGAATQAQDIREMSNFAVQPTNGFVERAWDQHYTAINRANVVIDRLEGASWLSEEKKTNYINEARFLRGFIYFNLVRYFGGVPIVLHNGEGVGAPRNTIDEVYEQIIEDLEAGETLPADYSTLDSKASSLAASAFLSKVYLVWAQTSSEKGKANQKAYYQKSIEYADKVISSGKYSLVKKFVDVFATNKKHGPEHIFTIEHEVEKAANVSGHCTFATHWKDEEPTMLSTSRKYYDDTDVNDQRRDGSWAPRLTDPEGNVVEFTIPRFRKYIDTINYYNPNSFGIQAGQNTNTAVIRYAEVLLIKAEAENELNGPTAAAYDAINQVRRRAYLDATTGEQKNPTNGKPLNLSGLSQDEFRDQLREERRLEFILEGQRWFDLTRWHILVKYIKANTPPNDIIVGSTTLKIQNVSKKNYYLPLPQSQIDLNPNLTQNWGYSGETGDGPYGAEFE